MFQILVGFDDDMNPITRDATPEEQESITLAITGQ